MPTDLLVPVFPSVSDRTSSAPPGGTGRPFDRAPRLPVDALADIVGGLARAESLWRPHVRHDDEQRARVRLLSTPIYEVWLLGWLPGQRAGLHDHGGANGAFIVVDGDLEEARSTGRPGGALIRRRLNAGDGATIDAGVAHDLANRSAGPATTLHAYSQPLRSMGFYEEPTPGVHGHRIRTHWVDPAPAVLAAK